MDVAEFLRRLEIKQHQDDILIHRSGAKAWPAGTHKQEIHGADLRPKSERTAPPGKDDG
jgi:hypothetical protein